MNPSQATSQLRQAIEAARTADDTADREAHIRTALGETVALRVQTDLNVAEAEEQLTNALVAPKEETVHFLNQADRLLDLLEDVSGVDHG